ncbi:MAG: CRISPR-associated endonuclease Cas2 [Nitrospirae bacterium]|nr:MAG: CRISPR-associated endonuclease Cas2 [Nitrospirota bacterium]
MTTYVLYDIPNDAIRTRVAEVCKDYGLQRVQFSAFLGTLTRNKREELYLRIGDVLGDASGKILIQPVCDKDLRTCLTIDNPLDEDDPSDDRTVDAAGH